MVNFGADNTYELIEKAQNGDSEAMRILTDSNMGLVHSIAKKFTQRGVDYDDILQLGCIGLVNAIKKFDMNFEVKFSTYAVPLIIGEIKRFLRDDGQIKVSRVYRSISFKAGSIREKLLIKLKREPTIHEMAKEMNIDVGDLVTAFEATQPAESLYKSVDENEKVLLVDKMSGGVETENEIIDKLAISESINKLTERERKIITLRYFKEKKQREVATILGISQVQVSRLEKQILMKMRENFG